MSLLLLLYLFIDQSFAEELTANEIKTIETFEQKVERFKELDPQESSFLERLIQKFRSPPELPDGVYQIEAISCGKTVVQKEKLVELKDEEFFTLTKSGLRFEWPDEWNKDKNCKIQNSFESSYRDEESEAAFEAIAHLFAFDPTTRWKVSCPNPEAQKKAEQAINSPEANTGSGYYKMIFLKFPQFFEKIPHFKKLKENFLTVENFDEVWRVRFGFNKAKAFDAPQWLKNRESDLCPEGISRAMVFYSRASPLGNQHPKENTKP